MRIPAIRVEQWLDDWDDYDYDEASRQRRPKPYFYVCSMPAALVKRLSGVRRRDTGDLRPRAEDIGIQRGHETERSRDIARFVRAGYPWATLNTEQRKRFRDLKKPGWLPTAIVANLVGPDTERAGAKADPGDLIQIESDDNGLVYLLLPEGSDSVSWERSGNLAPVEIIDGQHRLFAFDEEQPLEGSFDLPVVLFDDLDISWQAYLFWTINITPKRINPSLAYDLYPLLRTADWLESFAGPMAYRETRAQELTEALWSHPRSPWQDRIGMLGRERGKVTQAAFVRSLTLSFCRGWTGNPRTGLGGFFGTEQSGEHANVLPWNRAQQAAYLIALWDRLASAIADSGLDWAVHLRQHTPDVSPDLDAALAGRFSMLASDQGVRGFLQVCNDISYDLRQEIPFGDWRRSTSAAATDLAEVGAALEELEEQQEPIINFVEDLGDRIANFDWRSAVTPGLPQEIEIFQSRYRGGSGYKQVRLQLLRHLAASGSDDIALSAQSVFSALGYDKE